MSALEEANAKLNGAKTEYTKGYTAALEGGDRCTEFSSALAFLLAGLNSLRGGMDLDLQFANVTTPTAEMIQANNRAHGLLMSASERTTNPHLRAALEASIGLTEGFEPKRIGGATLELLSADVPRIIAKLEDLIGLVDVAQGRSESLRVFLGVAGQLGATAANGISDYQAELGLPQ